jgi:hypothetical protein
MISLGNAAYNAYCDIRKWKSVRGEPLPQYENQSPELVAAWEAAAVAAVTAYMAPLANRPQTPTESAPDLA